MLIGDNYRDRGRGESTSGSITNQFGDRLKTRRLDTTATRILARLIAHATKIPIRTKEAIIRVIIRHAPRTIMFIMLWAGLFRYSNF